jgi:hypothetical protein
MPCISGGYQQAVYLSSTLDLPEENFKDLAPGILAYRINQQIEQVLADKALVWSIKVADLVLAFSVKSFGTHLKAEFSYFGQGSDIWSTAFDAYRNSMINDLKAQIPIEQKKVDYYSESDLAILDHLLCKLDAILNHGAMSGAPIHPELDGKVPLLCPLYMEKMMDSWKNPFLWQVFSFHDH